jgi:hypothetical protein
MEAAPYDYGIQTSPIPELKKPVSLFPQFHQFLMHFLQLQRERFLCRINSNMMMTLFCMSLGIPLLILHSVNI